MADQPHRTGRRARWVALGVAVVLVVSVVGWLGFQFLNARDEEQRRWCVGLDATSAPGFQLHKTDDGQCIGWTIEQRAVAFGSNEPRVSDVITKIVEENNRVRDQSAQYVRVGVLLPMPADSDKPALFPDAAYHSL